MMEELLQQLQELRDVMAVVYDKWSVAELAEKNIQYERSCLSERRKKVIIKDVIAFIVAYYIFVLIISFIMALIGALLNIEIVDMLKENPVVSIIVYIFMVMSLILGAFVTTKHCKQLKEDLNTRVTELKTVISEERYGANKVLSDNRDKLKVLPVDYHYPVAIDYIIKVISTNRASTLNEALDMYDQQLHRWNMEKMMQKSSAEMIRLQKQQTEYLSSIRREINMINQNTTVMMINDML